MINTVYKIVLGLLNKNNFGYIPPTDFNLFSNMAQLELFTEMSPNLNRIHFKRRQGRSGGGYADEEKVLIEAMDKFFVREELNQLSANKYSKPTSNNLHTVNKIFLKKDIKVSSTTTAFDPSGTALNDSNVDFVALGVVVGQEVFIKKNGSLISTTVTAVIDVDELTVASTELDVAGLSYSIYPTTNTLVEADRQSLSQMELHKQSMITKPSLTFPMYSESQGEVYIEPSSAATQGRVVMDYIRFPKEPKWTYVSLAGGQPIFNPSATDYQDFELESEFMVDLSMRILSYAGLTIDRAQVVQYAEAEEAKQKQFNA